MPMTDPLPPLSAIRVFEATARLMSFTRAAAELGMTQAAVSYQIKLLEERLGTPLFLRRPRALVLTEAGQWLAPRTSDAFALLREAYSRFAEREQQTLVVNTMHTFAAQWLAPRLGVYQLAHPKTAVQLETTQRLVDFSREEVDVAIRYGAGRYPGLEVTRLMQETVIAVASPDLIERQPLVDLADLANHVLLHDGSPDADESCPDWSMWLTARGVRGVEGTRGPRFNQSSLVIEAAVGGRGVALAKRALAQADLDAGRLVAPFQIATAVDFAYYVVHPKAKGRLPQVKAFVAWLIAEAEAHEAALATIDNGAGI